MQYRPAAPNYSDRLRELLELLEGVRYRPYIDDQGWVTIGIGFNLGQANSDNRNDLLLTYLNIPSQSAARSAFNV